MPPRVLLLIPACVLPLMACSQGHAETSSSQAVEDLVANTQQQLVTVKGGSFQMGDFGPIDPLSDSPGSGLPYSTDQDNKHLHKVTLDTYKMMATKVTYADYDVFTEATNKPKINNIEGSFDNYFRRPDVPAGVTWEQARDYCQWLGEQTGEAYSLPTEAQWEYAARSRGEFKVYGTKTGNIKKDPGLDLPSRKQVQEVAHVSDGNAGVAPYPVTLNPPNPLGLYQMGHNGLEWMSDWYQPDYYEHSPGHNPQGPENGQEKVERGISNGEGVEFGMTFTRRHDSPDLTEGNETQSPVPHTFRCVANQ